MQPIDYGVQIPDPTQSFLSAFQTGTAIQEASLKQQQQQQQMANQRLIQEGLAKIRQPGATVEDVSNLAMILPKDQSETVIKAFQLKTDAQKQNALNRAGKVVSALFAGENDIAQQLISDEAVAMRNSGNEEGAKFLETWRGVTEVNPTASQNFFTAELLRLPGGDKIVENIVKLQEDRRKAQIQPFTLRQETANALIKEAEAKFAPDKFGAELGLTQAQIDASKAARRASDAAAAKSGADARRAQAEADQISAGIIPADKRPEAETKFRREYSDQTKGYQEVKSAYGRVLSSEDNAVGDLSLIFGYMKMLDPGSVVREGEFATAQNAAGVPERIQNVYNKVISGERLSASQRNAFKGQAGKLYTTAQQQEAQVRQGIERIAKGYGLKTENIFYTPTETAPTAPGAPAPAAPGAPAPAQVSVTAPNGQVITFPNQQAADAFKKAAGIR
ncbi:hypothetical protein UFOVP768_29 [uncultured Caudovirales phage]|uniref:Uncharacterized protein n=1 Tax=uncultured Caudovirales phage TaxID=2100421 RepID=A0A6J5NTK3_9CAUD|nr:hypothetical protein UFOVP320_33 [uncultured Caudovirales phage]CAB4160986.1 hypothetical protein UFOVP768_29 [uncultured Caudovirales phage]